MRTKFLMGVVVCLLTLSWSSHGWGASFPSGKDYVRIQAFSGVDIYGSAMTAINGIGYSCTGDLTNPDLLKVQQYGTSGDILLWASHGESGNVAVEFYSTQSSAEFRKDWLEQVNFQQGDLCVSYCREVKMYYVGLTNQGINNTFSASLACVASCYSTSTAGKWGSHEVGYAGEVTDVTAQTEMTALFDNLTAKDDYDTMTVASAVRGSQTLMHGNGNIALLPWVASFAPTDYLTYAQYVTVYLTFGGPMSSVNFIVGGGYGIKNSQGGSGNTWWVKYQTGWEVGEVIVGIIASQGISSNGIPLKADWTHSWRNMLTGYPAAASVASFIPYLGDGGVRIYTDLSMMHGSKSFWVERLDGSLVGDTVWADKLCGHEFELIDAQGQLGEVYRLKEQETNGRVFIRAVEGVFETRPEIMSDESCFDAEALRQELARRYSLGSCSQLGSTVGLIICPDSMAVDARLLASFWQSHGLAVVAKTLSETGHSREQIKAYIQQAYANGVRYVLLAGSASDYEWFDDPTKWPDLAGNDDWYYWYQDYHTPGGYFYWVSQPGRNLIPTWCFPDTAYDNMSYWTPYYSGDWYYAEGLPELRLGRFPAANRQQLLAMIAKDIDYVEEVNAYPWQNNVSVWGFCQSWDGNNGPLMKALALDFMSQIPESYEKYALLDTAWTYTQREAQGLADWNSGRGIIWMMGASSTPYKPNQFFSKSGGWSISKHQAGKLTLLIGANCGIGAYDLAQDPTYGEFVAQELLAADADRGAWAVIAPTRGTWIEGNRQMYQLLNSYLCVEPVQDLGTAFMLAQREARYGAQSMCAESYNLLGDPMAPLPGKTLTGLGEVMPSFPTLLHQNYPNPFNPITTIEYSLEARSYVSLRVYNVAGQLEKILVEGIQEMGRYRLGWDGRDSQGRSLASGVYFCLLETDSFSQTRKMILLR